MYACLRGRAGGRGRGAARSNDAPRGVEDRSRNSHSQQTQPPTPPAPRVLRRGGVQAPRLFNVLTQLTAQSTRAPPASHTDSSRSASQSFLPTPTFRIHPSAWKPPTRSLGQSPWWTASLLSVKLTLFADSLPTQKPLRARLRTFPATGARPSLALPPTAQPAPPLRPRPAWLT